MEVNKCASSIMRRLRGGLSRIPGVFLFLVVFVVGVWVGGGLLSGESPSADGDKPADDAAGSTTEEAGQAEEGEVWSCSMHPQIQSPRPGQCPICGMDLIPVDLGSGDGAAGPRRFVTTRAAAKLMALQTAPVERRYVETEIRMVGKLNFNETKLAYITAWVPGRIDELYVDYTGIRVNKGDHMVHLYSPELLTAYDELRRAKMSVDRLRDGGAGVLQQSSESNLKAVREKLRRWGLTATQIEQAEAEGITSDHITIYAPTGGTVIDRNGQEGMYVDTGTRIYTIANLDELWVQLDAYESDLQWLKYGQTVEFTTEAYPGEKFEGKIVFIDPYLDPATRTTKVRLNVANPDGRLKPEMFVRAVARSQIAAGGRVMDPDMIGKWVSPMHPEIVKAGPGSCDVCGMALVPAEELGYVTPESLDKGKPLVIPRSAALVTGTRAIVYVEVPDAEKPTFEGREIVLGPRAGEYYIVRSGLEAGERVVVNGNFKIDSALQIMAKPSMMTPGGGAQAGPGAGGDPVELAYASRAQIEAVSGAVAEAQAAAEAGDIEALRSTLADVEEAIERVDMAPLTGDAHAIWMEYARRLENDAVEARHATNEEVRERALQGLSEDLQALTEKFNLEGATEGDGRIEAPEAFRARIEALVEAYLRVKEALAGDDLAAAREALSALTAAEADVDMGLVSGDAHEVWMARHGELGDAIESLEGAAGIEAFREAFEPLSDALADTVRTFGVASETPVYRVHCPMALGGAGADWLQTTPAVRNPYYGDTMLNCGDVVDQLAGPPRAPADADPHAGHDHD